MEEHDYMGLKKEDGEVEEEEEEEEGEGSCGGSLKGTELRLGLPGSESPERVDTAVLSLAPPNGFCGLGSKRVFSDAISASGGVMKWVFSSGGANGSAEGEYRKGGGMRENSDVAVADGPAKVTGVEKKKSLSSSTVRISDSGMAPPVAKAQVVGWPPIRSYRKNSMVSSFPTKNSSNSNDDLDVDEPGKKHGSSSGCLYVKVSMDGAPYLRKVDLKSYRNYKDLSSALEKMFSCFTIGQCGSTDIFGSSENVLTYEDKDGDWMLVGDVPWDMFTETCKRLRIMKGSDAIGLAPRAMGKSKARN